jgi:hypothetical protein
MNPDGTNPRQLTTELAPVSSFDATRDGSLVAFSAGGVLSLIDIDGANLRRLTGEGRYEYAPVFLPDDAWLVVGRRDADGADLGFWLVPLPGIPGEERLLLDHGAPALGSAELGGDGIGGTDGMPGWMPRTAIDPTGRWALIVTAGGEATVVDLGAGPVLVPPEPVALVTDASAAWSTRHGAFLVTAVAKPDGSNASRASALWTITSTGAIRKLDGTDGAVGPVGVGPDGSIAVTFRRTAVGSAGIAILEPGATALSHLPSAPTLDDRWPAFSPDGATIVVGRTYAVRPDDGDGIWSLDLSTEVATQLSTDGAYARWLP